MEKKDNDNLTQGKPNLQRVNLLEVLLDDSNREPIYFLDDKGNHIKFEQIAVIPYEDDELYCILKPLTKIEGIADNEAIVFKVDEDEEGEPILKVEEDESIAVDIFNGYYDLVEKESRKKQRKK